MSILKCCIVRSWAEFPCYLCVRPIPYCAALTNRHSIDDRHTDSDKRARRDSELPTKSTAVSTESDRTYLEQLGYRRRSCGYEKFPKRCPAAETRAENDLPHIWPYFEDDFLRYLPLTGRLQDDSKVLRCGRGTKTFIRLQPCNFSS